MLQVMKVVIMGLWWEGGVQAPAILLLDELTSHMLQDMDRVRYNWCGRWGFAGAGSPPAG